MSSPVLQDIGPDGEPGGRTIGIAGDEQQLYAVSVNAGVWRSSNGFPWAQLHGSPPRAYCIAVDPADHFHVVVGEHRDLGANPTSGVWESTDGGIHWSYIFDPLAAGCPDHYVPSVDFTAKGSLVIATSGGIFWRQKGQAAIQPATMPNGFASASITAVVASATKVWGRTADYVLMVSSNDGASWDLPPATNAFPANIVGPSPGDVFSLGAFDSMAVMICLGADNGAGNNFTQLLIYDAVKKLWIVQPQISDSLDPKHLGALNGTGAGGRRFIRSYDSVVSEMFVCDSEEVYRVTGRNNDGTLIFVRILSTGIGGGTNDPLWKNAIHNDLWSFHWAGNGQAAWAGSDGGVAENLINGAGWVGRSAGLHTHLAHLVTAVSGGPKNPARLVYPTQDNDVFLWDEVDGWVNGGFFGDGNGCDGDAGDAEGVISYRDLKNGVTYTPVLTFFDLNKPGDQNVSFTITNSPGDYVGFVRPFLQFVQTPWGEAASLDAVLLAKLPLTFVDGNGQVKKAPGNLGDGSLTGWALLRNPSFAQFPNVNAGTGYQGWGVEISTMPVGVRGFWVSDGHASPTYFAYASTNAGLTFHRWDGSKWNQLPTTGLIDGAKWGPAHVNPFDPDVIFVLTQTGVQSWDAKNQQFVAETQLSSLLTGSGNYPVLTNTLGYDSTGVDPVREGINSMATLSHVAFNRYSPNEVVAASPFTGIFYRNILGQWLDLSGCLPRPCAPVSGVAIDNQAIYVSTEGRGVFRISGYHTLDQNPLLKAITEEIVAIIVLGVINDAPGIQIVGGHPEPVPPWGPVMSAMAPAVRDAVLGVFIERLATLMSDRAARGRLLGVTERIVRHDLALALAGRAMSDREGRSTAC